MSDVQLKSIIEALLFVADKPLSVNLLKEITDSNKKEIIFCLEKLEQEYKADDRGIQLVKVAGGYQLATKAELASWIRRLYSSRQLRSLSQAAMETLAIVAYRQPIIRAEVEAVRGVDVSGILRMLLERKLIKMAGRKKIPGRPIMYGTTRDFLIYLGLDDLSGLPKLEELKDLLPQDDDNDGSKND